MANQLKKFCKITRYIEQIDGELARVISDLCLDRLFIPRGGNGITFLYPAEKDYRKDIIKSAYSNEPENAIQTIESLIITDHLPRPGDFVLKKDDIPNLLRQRIEVTSADASSVKLACGGTLHVDPGFVAINSRENMAVYHLKGKGRIPLDGPRATMKYAKIRSKLGGKSRGHSGGYYGGDERSAALALYEEAKATTLSELKRGAQMTRVLTITTTFLRYLLSEHPDRAAELVHMGRISPCPLACFFTAVNPLGGDLYVSNFVDAHSKTNYESLSRSEDALTEFQELVKECYEKAGAYSEIHGDENLRRSLQQKCISNIPSKALEQMLSAYKEYYHDQDAAQKYLPWHELSFITLRFIYDAMDERGNQAAQCISEAFDEYKRVQEGGGARLVDPEIFKRGCKDPAYVYSGPGLFIASSFALGGPMGGRGVKGGWEDESLGSSDADAFQNPQAVDGGLVNAHAITSSMYGAGHPAKLTLGGMRAMLAKME